MTRMVHRGRTAYGSPRRARRGGGWWWVLAAALALAAAPALARAASAPAAAPSPERIRAALEHHVFHTPAGDTFTAASMSGQVVVLHLWATWCAPCRRELPRLDELDREIEKRGGRVLAVSIDLDARNVERFARQQRLHLPLAVDGPDGLARELDVPAIPYTMVLNRSGEVVSQIPGSGEAMLDATAATARRLIAEKPMAARTDSEEAR